MRTALLLVAELPAGYAPSVPDDEPLTLQQRLDEAVLSTVRAAAASSLPLIMPYDAIFAPLAALVMVQYATPRHAEWNAPRSHDEASPPPLLRFIDASVRPRSRAARLALWHSVTSALGVVSAEIASPEEVLDELSAAMLLGSGRVVRAFLERLRGTPEIPIYSLQGCTRFTERDGLRFADHHLRSELGRARGRRVALGAHEGETFPETPGADTRSRWQPYALFAQHLVADLQNPDRR